MLLRILILVLILWLALELLFRGLRFLVGRVAEATRIPRPPGGGDSRPGAPKAVEGELVRCAACRIRVPRNRALESGGALYCSAACRDSGSAPP